MMTAKLHGARWANPRQLHVTLRFLGDVPESDVPRIQHSLATVATPAFEVRLQGVGVFPEGAAKPSGSPPKVLWVGLAPTLAIATLKQAIDVALSKGVGLTQEARSYSPHLTLARFASARLPDPTLSHFLSSYARYAGAPWEVTEFHFYRSVLRREGAIHTKVDSYSLAKGGHTE